MRTAVSTPITSNKQGRRDLVPFKVALLLSFQA